MRVCYAFGYTRYDRAQPDNGEIRGVGVVFFPSLIGTQEEAGTDSLEMDRIEDFVGSLHSEIKEAIHQHTYFDEINVLLPVANIAETNKLLEFMKYSFEGGAPPEGFTLDLEDEIFTELSAIRERCAANIARLIIHCYGPNRASIDVLSDDFCLVLGGDPKSSDLDLSRVFRMAASNCFARYNGIMLAEHANYHFVLPSNDHISMFVRLSNVTNNPDSNDLLAIGLLDHIEKVGDVTEVYYDTGGIVPIIYRALALWNSLSHKKIDPRIQSFNSYFGLRQEVPAPKHRTSTAIGVVSVTGRSKIMEQAGRMFAVPDDNWIVLAYLGASSTISCAFNIMYDEFENREGLYHDLKRYSESNCIWCKSGSMPIRVYPDEVAIQAPKYSTIELKKVDGNALRETLKSSVGRKILAIRRAHVVTGPTGEPEPHVRPFAIILRNLVSDPTFEEEFQRYLDRYVPFSVTRILYPDNQSARLLAKSAYEHLKKNGKNGVRLQTTNDLAAELHDPESSESGENESVLVICDALETGGTFLDVSRQLRISLPKAPRTYITAFGKFSSESAYETLTKNLEMNASGPNHCARTIRYMIVPSTEEETGFETELGLYDSKEFKGLALGVDAQGFFEQRKELLNDCVDPDSRKVYPDHPPKGLFSEIFYPRYYNDAGNGDVQSEALKLSRGFVFWDSVLQTNYDEGSQADVYFTISSILQRLRHSSGKRSIRSSLSDQTVLDPSNFRRFNDGVIQASLLRAAKPAELNYSDQSLMVASEDMRKLLTEVFQGWNRGGGDAAAEFAFALATRRISLLSRDVLKLVPEIRKLIPETGDPQVPEVVGALLRIWLRREEQAEADARAAAE